MTKWQPIETAPLYEDIFIKIEDGTCFAAHGYKDRNGIRWEINCACIGIIPDCKEITPIKWMPIPKDDE